MDVGRLEADDLADPQTGQRAEHRRELEVGATDRERRGDRLSLRRLRQRLRHPHAVRLGDRVGLNELAPHGPLEEDRKVGPVGVLRSG